MRRPQTLQQSPRTPSPLRRSRGRPRKSLQSNDSVRVRGKAQPCTPPITPGSVLSSPRRGRDRPEKRPQVESSLHACGTTQLRTPPRTPIRNSDPESLPHQPRRRLRKAPSETPYDDGLSSNPSSLTTPSPSRPRGRSRKLPPMPFDKQTTIPLSVLRSRVTDTSVLLRPESCPKRDEMKRAAAERLRRLVDRLTAMVENGGLEF